LRVQEFINMTLIRDERRREGAGISGSSSTIARPSSNA
jgi:hypothetical protein